MRLSVPRALSKAGFLAAALLAAGLAAAAALSDESLDPYPYPFLNPSVARNERATDLINRLPLQTKVNLLQTANAPGIPGSGIPADPGWITLPNYTVETYTSVPCLHGLFGPINMTVFPQSITLAASWNSSLLDAVGSAIAEEARAVRNGFQQLPNRTLSPPAVTCLTPNINIARDPRWGRAQETYGECPFLTASLVFNFVRGMQGNHSTYVKTIAGPKHFDAYGGATSRGHRSPTEVAVSWRDWQETALPQFRTALVEAGAFSTMCSYNTLCICDDYPCACPAPSHGPPACADSELLTGLLREQWQSPAYVVGDAGAIKFVQTDHEYAASQAAAAADSLTAGVDLALGGGYDGQGHPVSFAALTEAVHHGLVNESSIDTALHRLVLAQLRLGLLDPADNNPYTKIPRSAANSPAMRALALQAAREGIVLLNNDAGVLPLKANRLQQQGALAVVGPNAQLVAFGSYSNQQLNNVTMLQGLQRRVAKLAFAPGCTIAGNETDGFGMAVHLAKAASVTVAVFGIDDTQEHETGTRSIVHLPGVQLELLKALKATGTKLVLVLVGGSAMAVPGWQQLADALVVAGYGGEEAGTALADVLFGDYNPAGRLPYTVPTGIEQLPPFGDYQMDTGACGDAACGRTYRYLDKLPLFHFGSGISYTQFETRQLQLSSVAIGPCERITVTVNVTNVGDVDGDEVTQLYISRHGNTAEAPTIGLAGFARTAVPAGGTRSLSFELRPSHLAVVQPKGRKGWVVQPCNVTVFVGGRQPSAPAATASDIVQSATFQIRSPEGEISLDKCGKRAHDLVR